MRSVTSHQKYEFKDNDKQSSSEGTNNFRSEETKIRPILSTWSDYLRLEDLTNAKVDAIKSGVPYVWDEKVGLAGNNLTIDKKLFKTLKEDFEAFAKKDQSEDYQIAAAFPTIIQFEDNQRKFRPLFTVDLSAIFSGNYREKGWDLTGFEFHPVLPNLIKFYGIEEEIAEKLPTKEGLKIFLESTFNRPFSTLQDFLQLIELPPKPLRTFASPYLLRFGYASYNHH
ncbi:MAG: superfamily I DNA/RNA helicase [Hydrococcus sp. RM1_1_31]|nr:superfamily I DNA/RNA helicase [Hydrococcus sp. RM1_1_31]